MWCVGVVYYGLSILVEVVVDITIEIEEKNVFFKKAGGMKEACNQRARVTQGGGGRRERGGDSFNKIEMRIMKTHKRGMK